VTETFHIINVLRSNSPEFIVKSHPPDSSRLSRRGTSIRCPTNGKQRERRSCAKFNEQKPR